MVAEYVKVGGWEGGFRGYLGGIGRRRRRCALLSRPQQRQSILDRRQITLLAGYSMITWCQKSVKYPGLWHE